MLAIKPLVVASVMEEDETSFLQALELAGEADAVEARVDALKNPGSSTVISLLRAIKASGKKAILTNRRKEDGGAFNASEAERRKVLESCHQEGDYVDLELQMRDLNRLVADARKAGTRVIISAHNFTATPGEEQMLEILKQEFTSGADIAKLAVTANSMGDVLRLLSATKNAAELGGVCTISMGPLGKLSRVAAPLFGSVMTYGYVTRPTAPGQLPVGALRQALNALVE